MPTRLHAIRRNEQGGQTIEYGATILVAVALPMALLTLLARNLFDSLLETLLTTIIQRVIDMITALF